MRDLVLDADRAQDLSLATFGQHGARQVREGAGKGDWPVFIRRPIILASQRSSPKWGQLDKLSNS